MLIAREHVWELSADDFEAVLARRERQVSDDLELSEALGAELLRELDDVAAEAA